MKGEILFALKQNGGFHMRNEKEVKQNEVKKAKQNETKEAKWKKQSEISEKQYIFKLNEGKTASTAEAKRNIQKQKTKRKENMEAKRIEKNNKETKQSKKKNTEAKNNIFLS